MQHTSLVTGGAGFIGSHVARELCAMGHEVIVLDDLSGGFTENVPKGVTFVNASVLDENMLDRLFRRFQFSYVFHLAAYAAEGLSHFIRKYNYENNVIGSINLINRSIRGKVKRFVFTSSIAVYGPNQTPMREDMQPQPEDPYGIAKYAVERDLFAAHQMFGLCYTIFRPHNVYGERQNIGDPYRNVIGIFMNNCMQGKPMTIFGNGKQTRAFSYISDVAPHIARSIQIKESENELINIGADTPISVNRLAQMVAAVMGVPKSIHYLPARKEVVHAFSDHAKARKIFGVRKTVPLEVGLTRMAAWAKENGARQGKLFTNIEVLEHMPPSWRKLLKTRKGKRDLS